MPGECRCLVCRAKRGSKPRPEYLAGRIYALPEVGFCLGRLKPGYGDAKRRVAEVA